MRDGKPPRLVDVRDLVLACGGCGAIITDDVRVSPEPSQKNPERLVVYVRACPLCFPPP